MERADAGSHQRLGMITACDQQAPIVDGLLPQKHQEQSDTDDAALILPYLVSCLLAQADGEGHLRRPPSQRWFAHKRVPADEGFALIIATTPAGSRTKNIVFLSLELPMTAPFTSSKVCTRGRICASRHARLDATMVTLIPSFCTSRNFAIAGLQEPPAGRHFR